MQLPSEVIIGGITYKVIMVNELYNSESHIQINGEISFSDRTIQIATKQRYILGNKDFDVDVNDDVILRTFFHELWHGYCSAIWEDELNTEQNACTFATMCICLGGSPLHFIDWQIKGIIGMIDNGFIDFTETQKKKLLWLIKGLTFGYEDTE